ncbi:MAG: recombinase family protein [Armatimonadetes bacterium]|nr:recombinase family protein [Armatimonadota bacterium]
MSKAYTPRDYLHGHPPGPAEETGLAVVAYARVSHEESAESGLSIPQQLDNIRAFCQQKGWEIIAEFKDEGASAYRESEDRPAFRQMIEFCLASQHTPAPVRYIVVDKFDRFSRDDYVNAFYKHTLLPSHGIQVISVAEPFDTSSVGGWLVQRVIEIASVARSMEDACATMRAMIRNAAEGHSCGGKCPWGYMRELVEVGRDPKGQPITRTEWVPDPQLAPHVVELFKRLADGDSLTSIARDFTRAGIPSPSGKPYWTKTTVYDLARRVYVYEGTRVWNMVKKRTVRLPNGRTVRRFELKDPRLWIRVENAYPRLIPPDLARREAARKRVRRTPASLRSRPGCRRCPFPCAASAPMVPGNSLAFRRRCITGHPGSVLRASLARPAHSGQLARRSWPGCGFAPAWKPL